MRYLLAALAAVVLLAGCSDDPVPADTDGNGSLDGFTGVSPGSSVTFEVEAYNQLVDTEDRREGVLAFNEKRAPQFKGR